jgi:hypothetical protein
MKRLPLNQINAKKLPTFLGIGSQRCASTWLDQMLRLHPEIFMAPKECNFFSNKIKTESLECYCRLFEVENQERRLVQGEISPSYAAMFPEEIAIVKRIIPDLKVILIIRNPVEHCISQITRQWTYYYVDKGASINRNIFHLLRSIDSSQSYRLTDYLSIYKNWLMFFGAKNIFIETYDVLNSNPKALMIDILSFLEVDTNYDFSENIFKQKPNCSKIESNEIPFFLKWYLSREWLSKVRQLQSELDLDVSAWIDSMENTISEGKLYYHLIWFIHKIYFCVPYNFFYGVFNLFRIRFRIYLILRKANVCKSSNFSNS